MLKLDDTLYFSSVSYNYQTTPAWEKIYNQCGPDGQFFMNISKRINPCRFITRNGEWSLPWKQELIPGFEMPAYDPNFSKSFDQVTDEQAQGLRRQVAEGKKFAVMYSGGIDSTVVLASLIKNFTDEELKSVYVCASAESIIENPVFWGKFVHEKLNVLDSKKHKYDDLIEMGLTPITADEGDCIFGTLIGLNFYNNFDYYISNLEGPTKQNLARYKYKISDPSVHYSVYKDLIIRHLGLAGQPNFGRVLYEKYVRNAETASVPVHTLHDFFWWLIFNVKYLNCSVRGVLYYNDRVEWDKAIRSVVNWFNYADYQRWSMANNNNGEKIQHTASSYKWAARRYIHSIDKNDWYLNFKTKIESMWNIGNPQDVSKLDKERRPITRIALTKDYEMIYINDPGAQEYFQHHLSNYKVDWTDL